MAHEVETLMYVCSGTEEEKQRQVPWHGLGTPVSDAPTSIDAIRLAGLDWEVEARDVYINDSLGNRILVPNCKANVRTSDDSVLGMVTNRYKIVQNKEAFDFTDSLIGEGCKYETAGSLFNGRKVFLLARMPQTKILDEEFDPFICFTNTHDGSGAIKACITPTRVVCNNTLNIALKEAKRHWSAKHIGNLEAKLEEAKRTLELANHYMEEFAIVADQMANTSISVDDQQRLIETLFPIDEEKDSDRKKRNTMEDRANFQICMMAPDILKFKGTAYQMLQAASDFATHTAPQRNTSTFRERNFNAVLEGHNIIDTTFDMMMSKVAA